MKNRLFALVLLTIIAGCSKDKINVSKIYMTDATGFQIATFPNDNQWKQQSFSNAELALFNDLDTASLAGTTMPTVLEHYYASPNPFTDNFFVPAKMQPPFSGTIVVKYVIVNSKMQVQKKAAFRLAVNNYLGYSISGDFSPGNYRFYFTYSAEGHKNFFTSWGNIQKL